MTKLNKREAPKSIWYQDQPYALDREEAMVSAFAHIRCLCNNCIRAHRQIIRQIKRIKKGASNE